MANWIRLQPLMREPWMHLCGIAIGAYGGNKYALWRKEEAAYYDAVLARYRDKQEQKDQSNEELDSSWRQRKTA